MAAVTTTTDGEESRVDDTSVGDPRPRIVEATNRIDSSSAVEPGKPHAPDERDDDV